ncbi:uncharacterized protein LAJ45_02357 [Morchella importuna]|uniref:uncharacterized protein n=1 Tax=Morchella importuna TaxID=1174673 RepID=UPI001E8CB283|nr:uncharacterized protein LAJ45_02357 [Morchella importuna]KAH8153544.1 hypothetical protein LAJ45_02357 [Morchella importuna]
MSVGSWILILALLFVQWPTVIAQGDGSNLADDRRPALYTGDFGNCMENSTITISRFDAAYYADNMTVLFHIDGKTSLVNDNLMIYLTVDAYGESRFSILFNPCNANLPSLCPARSGVNITAAHIIPVSQADVSEIPAIAFAIPDFEGRADLRIFSNSTNRQVACVTAIITNGKTFSHPKIISSVLGGFAFIVFISSFVAACSTFVTGDGIIGSRSLYAHSLSVYMVFSCFHSIFFTGALSIDFPSVLISFWSNFAWSAGLIKAESMQDSLDRITRKSAPSIDAMDPSGQALDLERELYSLSKRHFQFGVHQKEGLPVPGGYLGFPATLAQLDITATNAFMTAFLWFLVLLVSLVVVVVGLKLILGACTAAGLGKDRVKVFRDNWLAFLKSILCRTVLIAFFPMMLLATFQFTLKVPGPQAIAAIVFMTILIGVSAGIAHAYVNILRGGRLKSERESRVISLERKFGFVPWCKISRQGSNAADQKPSPTLIPWWKLSIEKNQERDIHDEETLVHQFGWLSARFRRRRWWFFGPWFLYEFIRALFYGGGQSNPRAQILGLLALEIIALGVSASASPFQSVRLNALIYVFGIMKISTLAIIAALMLNTGTNRIVVTVLGIVIIVFQGVTVLAVIIFGAVNVYTTYFVLAPLESRIKPESCIPVREKYLKHIQTRSVDIDPPPKVETEPVVPSFSVTDVRRYPKIDDEYDDQRGPLFSGSSQRATMSDDPTAPRANAPSGVRLPRRTWSPSQSWTNEGMSSIPHLASSRTDWPILNPPPASINNSFRKETPLGQAQNLQSLETDVHTFPQKF